MSTPKSVGTIGCLLLLKIRAPIDSSTFCICILRVGWVTQHFSAAATKLRYVSTATIYSSCTNVMFLLSWGKGKKSVSVCSQWDQLVMSSKLTLNFRSFIGVL